MEELVRNHVERKKKIHIIEAVARFHLDLKAFIRLLMGMAAQEDYCLILN